jgi:hypothetical protein
MFLPLAIVAAYSGYMYWNMPKSRSRPGNQLAPMFAILTAMSVAGPFTGPVISVRGVGFVLALCAAIGALLYFIIARTRVGTWPIDGIAIAAMAWSGTGGVVFMSRATET